jgi:carbon-monoxide dehydrogenase medium subunit
MRMFVLAPASVNSRKSLPMKPPRFRYERPASVAEAVALLSAHGGDAKLLAGGQSLMPMLAFRLAAPRLIVDITRIPGLNDIALDAGGSIRLGALVRWRDIERHPRLAAAHPLLLAATAHVAHYQIRNRGTVGGSLAHADPAAELPGVVLCCEAEIVVAGPAGTRAIKAESFFTGALTTALAPDEMICELRFPPWPKGRRWAFEEFSRRRGDFALAGVALFFDVEDERVRDPHVAAIGVADRPVRLAAVEAALAGRRISEENIRAAAAASGDGVEPPDDIHAPADYRRALLAVLTERALRRAAGLPQRDAA